MTGSLVRIDIGVIVPAGQPDEGRKARAVVTQQLVMPLEGFVRSFGMQEQVIKKLIADGVLQPKQDVAPSSKPVVNTGSTTPQ